MRVLFIDAARAVAILGACGHHALLLHAAGREMRPAEALFSAMAGGFMPLFLLLFGVALELVYHRRAQRQGLGPQARSLLRRALLCYGCFLLATAVPAALGLISPGEALRVALLRSHPVFYSGILPLWVILLSAAGPLLWLRARVGPAGLLAAGFGAWFVVPFLYSGPWPGKGSPFSVLSATLFGWPRHLVGTDVLHTLVFVTAGIFLGAAIARSRERGAWGEYGRAILLLAGATLALAAVLVIAGDDPTRWASLATRRQLRAGYSLFGMLETLAVIGACSLLVPPRTQERTWHRYAFGLGRHSLFAFTLSSCLLALARACPGWFPGSGPTFAAAHLALLAAACAAVAWRSPRSRARPVDAPDACRSRPDLGRRDDRRGAGD